MERAEEAIENGKRRRLPRRYQPANPEAIRAMAAVTAFSDEDEGR